MPAVIIGVEPTINLGILKIETEQSLAASSLVVRTVLESGQQVFAPSGWGEAGPGELIEGELSALNTRECYQESLTGTMLRAYIDLPDSSIGGPVFNQKGEVIAIYTGYTPPVMAGHQENPDELHILPAFLASNIYASLKHKRSLRSPWTGFSVRPLTEKEQRWFPAPKGDEGGIGIEYVWENSPAASFGLEPGDLLVRFGYYRIESPADFQKWLYMYGVGHTVKLVFLRGGDEYRVVEYTIEARPDWAKPR